MDRNTEGVQPGRTRREVLKLGGAAFGLAAVGPVLAACGSAATPATTGSAAPRRGGHLTIGFPSGGPGGTFDPDTGSQPTVDYARWNNVYDQLLIDNKDFKITPSLAESCTPNADATMWTIRLRKGVTFHDGRPVTADDVIYSLRRHAAKASTNAPLLAQVDIKALRKRDNLTVDVPMLSPFALLDSNLTTQAGIVLPQDFNPHRPIGSGPFSVVSFRPGEQTVLKRYAEYWGGPAIPDVVTLVEFDDPVARSNALFANQVDAITALPQDQLRVAQASSSVQPFIAPSGGFTPFTMRTDTAPFDDVRVRQAMRLIVNRPQIIEEAIGGQGTLGNDVFGRWDPTYAGDTFPQRHQDIEQARSLLKAAGHDHLTVQLVTSPLSDGVVEASTVFAQQARAAGVTIQIKQLPSTAFYNSPWPYPFGVDIWGTPLYFFVAAEALAPGAPYPETGWSNPRWTRLYNEAIRQVDLTKRREISTELQRIDYDEGGYIVWGFPNYVDGVSKKIGGIVHGRFQMPLGDVRFARVGFVA